MPTTKSRAACGGVVLLLLSAVSLATIAQGIDASSFAGFLEMTASTTQSDALTVEEIAFNVALSLGDYTAQVDASFTETSFDTLRLSATGSLGAFDLSSNVAFNPSTLEFLSWQMGTAFTFLDLDVGSLLYVTAPQTASYTQLTLQGDAGPFTFDVGTKLGICPLEFWEASFCANWPWDDCETTMGACVQVTGTSGVQAVDFTMADYVLFESLLGMEWSLSVALSFTPESKTLTPTLNVTPDWFLCPDIEILAEVTGGAGLASVESISIYGIRGECVLSDCFTIGFADSLTDEKNSALTGKADYFELIQISGCFPSCCGTTGSFDLAAYFERPPAPSGALFGLGLITGSFSLQIGPSLSFAFDAELPTSGPGWKLLWTFQIFWY